MSSQQGRILVAALLALALAAPQAWPQVCNPGGFHGYQTLPGSEPAAKNCVNLFWCHPPQLVFAGYETQPPGCDPTIGPCAVRANVNGTFPGNSNNSLAIGFFDSPIKLTWEDSGGGFVGSCGNAGARIQDDLGLVWIQAGDFSCANPEAATGTDTLRLTVPGAGTAPGDERVLGLALRSFKLSVENAS